MSYFHDKNYEYSSEAMLLCYSYRAIIYIINYGYIYIYTHKLKRNKWKSQPQTP